MHISMDLRLHALLYNFVNVNDVFGNNNNLAFYYKNLKMYEDKITFLLKSLWKAATNSNIRNFTEPRSK